MTLQTSIASLSCPFYSQDSEASLGSCTSCAHDADSQKCQAVPIMSTSAEDIVSGHFVYHALTPIGQGTFGRVVRAVRSGTPHHPPCIVAIKLLPRGSAVREYRTFIRREILHQSILQHPFIISIQEVFLTKDHLAIAMEYAEGGDLHATWAHRPERRFPEEQARWIFQQLIIGLDYCHRKGVANRDLKLENLLLDRKWYPHVRPLLKICDFGYSKHDINSPAKTGVGTPVYMAPEIILGGKFYDAKIADLWSCGVILFALVYGDYPFHMNERHFARKIVKGQFQIPEHVSVSAECRSLIQHLLVPEPKSRIGIEQILRSPWFNVGLPPAAHTMNDWWLSQAAELREYMVKIEQIIEQSTERGYDGEDLTHANVLAPKAEFEAA